MSIQLSSLLPTWCTLLLLGGLLAALAYGTLLLVRKGIPRRLVAGLTFLRLLIVAVFVLILLQPILSYSSTRDQLPELMILVDTSRSMGKTGAKGQGSRLDE